MQDLDDAHDDLEELQERDLLCRASQCALTAVWVSIFTASADKGVVPAWRANGSMLLLSLSHRYMSPLWWLITYLSEPKYGING